MHEINIPTYSPINRNIMDLGLQAAKISIQFGKDCPAYQEAYAAHAQACRKSFAEIGINTDKIYPNPWLIEEFYDDSIKEAALVIIQAMVAVLDPKANVPILHLSGLICIDFVARELVWVLGAESKPGDIVDKDDVAEYVSMRLAISTPNLQDVDARVKNLLALFRELGILSMNEDGYVLNRVTVTNLQTVVVLLKALDFAFYTAYTTSINIPSFLDIKVGEELKNYMSEFDLSFFSKDLGIDVDVDG